MAKNTKCFKYSILYNHRGLKCLEGRIFLPKKSGFATEARFNPKRAISALNLKLCVTTWLPLFSKTYNHTLNIIVARAAIS